jgi:photosystem II stability/assembly factor-like uncharacterized protein
MRELLVGTRKGLFALQGEPGSPFEPTARAFAGETVENAMRDPRTGRVLASVTSAFYGPKIWYADDLGGEWTEAEGVTLPEGGEQALQRIWVITPGEEDGLLYAGGDPGVLFESRDGGASWQLNRGFWEQPSRPKWMPGGGGLCLHSIVTWPGDPQRLAIAISAAGVWLTDDGGETWRRGNGGLTARYLPDDTPEDEIALCVHRIHRSPKRPERMFLQFHGGVYRSDDAGETWSARGEGLPAEHAYLTVLREAFDRRGEGDALELYFGATSGDVFGSADAGATWFTAATHLPPVYSVRT